MKNQKELDTSIKLKNVDFNTKIKTNNSYIKMLKTTEKCYPPIDDERRKTMELNKELLEKVKKMKTPEELWHLQKKMALK